jgi:formylglycine-generating enzyme required for sulfatase activity/predicted phosphodiesterase
VLESKFTWLHLSDWHQQDQYFDRKVVRDALLEDIHNRVRISSELAKIDMLFFTGDLAFSGENAEYLLAEKEFLKPVREAAAVAPENIFLIPGNHDLNRDEFELLPGELLKPLINEDRLKNWLEDKKKQEHLLAPFADFYSFANEYYPSVFGGAKLLTHQGKTIGITGVNSALMSGRNKGVDGEIDDYGKLVVGEPQIYEALNTIKVADIRIAVMHHPVEWLAEFDRSVINARLKDSCHFILRGHEHAREVKYESSRTGSIVIVPGGASYDRRKPDGSRYVNSYNYAILDINQGIYTIFIRKWDDEKNQWVSDGVTKGQYFKRNTIEGDTIILRNPISSISYYRESLTAYFKTMVDNLKHLPLRGMDMGASDASGSQKTLRLANIYIGLDTKNAVAESGSPKDKHLTVLEVVMSNRRIVLLGDPGSGKSTFLNHLAFCLAIHQLEPTKQLLDHLPGWSESEAGLVPILVTLRDFSRNLPQPLPSRAEPYHLWDFICNRLRAINRTPACEAIQKALETGQALVLMDGLDEVASIEQRLFVREAITAFADSYPDNRYIITCRVLSYQPPAAHQEQNKIDLQLQPLSKYPIFELAPFDEAKIDQFIGAWYDELEAAGVFPGKNKGEIAELAQALRTAVRRPDLWRLAPNPLLLMVMALLHIHKGRLPEARALLYEETVEVLLWRWERIRAGGASNVRALPELLQEAGYADIMDLKRVLWRLAYEAHYQETGAGTGNELADIGELKLEKALAELKNGDRNWAQQLIQLMKIQAGLLLEREPEVFTFPHRTFQEFLAGAHLSVQKDFTAKVCQLAEKRATWREAILLAVGRLIYVAGDQDRPLWLLAELCPKQPPQDSLEWYKVWLAGDIAVEISANRINRSNSGPDLLKLVKQQLTQLLEQGALAPRERADAGNCLALLGDTREAIMSLDKMEFCWIPAGSFWMGNESFDDEKLYLNQQLNYEYWISRYPVTNAQFTIFVLDKGYNDPAYWDEAEQAGVWREGKVKGRYDDQSRGKPFDFSEPFNLPNHPVVNITWYEALAFTHWLTQKWLKEGIISESQEVRLPSEAEWEKAARGGEQIPENAVIGPPWESKHKPKIKQNPKPQRNYPWGGADGCEPDLANFDQTGIRATSAVGCFPAGTSPYGVLELSGNVWEWTRSVYNKKYTDNPNEGQEVLNSKDSRVLRGGSWYDRTEHLRSSSSVKGSPDNVHDNVGFRVVCIARTLKA